MSVKIWMLARDHSRFDEVVKGAQSLFAQGKEISYATVSRELSLERKTVHRWAAKSRLIGPTIQRFRRLQIEERKSA